MRPSKTLPQVFIYRNPVDFREAHRVLAVIVETVSDHNLFDGYLYTFTKKASVTRSSASLIKNHLKSGAVKVFWKISRVKGF